MQLASRLEAGEALRVKNRQHLGNRYIEWVLCLTDTARSDMLQQAQRPNFAFAVQDL